jgi:hypothetical protein
MQGRQDAYEGEWWLPSDEANKVGGILDLGDTYQLRLLGSFDKQEPRPLEPTFDPSILLGRSLGKGITLLGGSFGPMTLSLFDGGSTIGIQVPVAFVGDYWLEAPEEAVFDKVDAELTNLLQWANQSAIHKEHHDDRTSTISNSWLPPSVASTNDAVLKIGHGFDDQHGAYSVSWTQHAGLLVDLSSPMTITDIDYKFVRPFRHLLSLASGVDCAAGSLRVANSTHLDEPRTFWLDVHAYGRTRAYERAELERPERMLFTLADIDLADFLPRWYTLIEKLGITADLLFSASSPHVPYVSNKLFNLASAAEGMHERLYPGSDEKTPEHRSRVKSVLDAVPAQHQDWLRETLRFSHKMSFEQRLRQLIEHAGPTADSFVGDHDKWTVLVKQLRNQYAHGAQKRRPIEDDVSKLSRLSATIDALLRLVLLREMGFSDEQCMAMTNRAPRWRFLKQVLPTEIPEIF